VSRIHMTLLTLMVVGFGWDYMGSDGWVVLKQLVCF
jgi:hypothetical protein